MTTAHQLASATVRALARACGELTSAQVEAVGAWDTNQQNTATSWAIVVWYGSGLAGDYIPAHIREIGLSAKHTAKEKKP